MVRDFSNFAALPLGGGSTGFGSLVRALGTPNRSRIIKNIFRVVSEDLITVDDEKNIIDLTFTPTIPHCSMATLIGLTIRVKLIRSLPSRFKVSVKITEGSHSQVKS